MAAGTVYQLGPTSTANGSYLDIQPASGDEVVIHNIYYAGAVEFEYYDGTNTIKFDSDTTSGARLVCAFHCTNSKRVRVKNVSGGSIYIAADGIYTTDV